MSKRYATALFIFFLTFYTLRLSASPQMPDYLIFKGDTIATYNLILELYLQKQEKAEQAQLFGLSFRGGASFNCWRGYQAIYKFDNDSLFLVDILNCGELRSDHIDKTASNEKMKAIFGEKMDNGRVYIDWFSGDISFPLSNKVVRWDGVFYKIFEKERVVSVTEGKVLKTEVVENYIDERKGINRREKNKISKILFRKLKKVKWKNSEDFDCSDRYLVTIDENGFVSKVRMLYSEEEIGKYYEKDEYNFCIDKMYNAFKSLKFDIIKSKGKPITEDIYIYIWIEDNGKIEDWTD